MIPLANVRVIVRRVVTPEDGYGEPTTRIVEPNLRAILSEPAGSRVTGFVDTSSETTRRLTCDPGDILPGDIVDHVGDEYIVGWVSAVSGPLAHMTAGLRRKDW